MAAPPVQRRCCWPDCGAPADHARGAKIGQEGEWFCGAHWLCTVDGQELALRNARRINEGADDADT